MRLNKAQKSAVTHTKGPLLVLAGAGSGKTGVITQRIAWLVQKNDIAPENIVAVTFTNKAAREMADRIATLVGKNVAKSLMVCTFHRFGLSVLRAESETLGLSKRFSIVDPKDAAVLMLECMRGGESSDAKLAERVQWRISKWKNLGLSVAPPEDSVDPAGRTASAIWEEYEQRLAATNSVDIDDLIVKPVQLFRSNPKVLKKWQLRARHLLIDEYQDTNSSQYELVQLLAGKGNGLTVVGDDDQSIYSWRGAQPENIARLDKDFKNLTVVKLEQNYRSMGRILKAANLVISNNPRLFQKNLFSESGYGDSIQVLQASSDAEEASSVVSNIMAHRFKKRTKWSDYAVLYRGNHQARAFEIKLRQMNVPYRVSGGPSFFDRSEIRDVMAYLRLLANNSDDSAFLRVVNRPRRGIGTTSIEALVQFASDKGLCLVDASGHTELTSKLKTKPAAQLSHFADFIAREAERAEDEPPGPLVRAIIEEIGYTDWLLETSKDAEDGRRRKENVEELMVWMDRLGAKSGKTLADVVSDLILASVLERSDDEVADEVSLMTLHAAKGLEFDYVTIAGLEEGLLPHRTSIELDDIDEERRLFYVGITRARRELTLTLARARRRAGALIDTEPSRFLDELPGDDLAWDGDAGQGQTKEAGRAELGKLRAMLQTDDASD